LLLSKASSIESFQLIKEEKEVKEIPFKTKQKILINVFPLRKIIILKQITLIKLSPSSLFITISGTQSINNNHDKL